MSAELVSEFASVRLSVDRSANGPRLRIVDTETGDSAYLDPLELASLCRATDEDRIGWLAVGEYREDDNTFH